jgi:Domain of unknown function DUF29
MHTETSLYDEDFYRWTQHQAALLRTEKWQDLDYINLAEELESLGKRDVRELESRLEVLVMHLLKWRYQPERRERGRSWRSTILEQRGRLQRLLAQSPSLRPQIPILVAEGYTRTRQRTLAETQLTESAIPSTCPWSTEQILDDAFWPEEEPLRQV